MDSQPNESNEKSDAVPEAPNVVTKGENVSVTASASSGAEDTSKDSGIEGKVDSKSPASKSTNENTTVTPSHVSPITKRANNPKPVKIKVHLVAVGSAPILKKSKFLMNADDRFAVAIAFLRKVLKLSSSTSGGSAAASSLFLYVNAAFVPSPDERMGDLFDCFGTRGELVIHYSLQEAWG
mmetsp:Transcript_5760/g.12685  ORF Transcript_5760/g.12685 Transcript_5760/m.12685 type:complete len:181 (+) Transcript_5760:169-711(+)|eukprot:CAMPEP_0172542168 /NCGR_PEP_ID=MMETSP1067-20121228/12834_1 /TAXON_ID=265564 ORGANISM="Thalassiosira punctigera, Strain Tpunct2005C2" /NCGR_SAMPLE_ID=MMETSP1067 /ASSEMBLY_ACC=CAM_ASM_000444 /LENGTH=180 /DNA_ID=CAMNT_0013328347 /DNA_START=165 /DNA_END=707 /DNA_ORIENTATION=+